MTDSLDIAGAQDRARIDINEDHEIRYWTEHLAVDEGELRKAVAEVGVSARAVAEHLGRP